ncbi:MAG: CD225/dispanin family protein [Bacteroidales bacterium]|jgi:hypothetical protein|nr:CD225/dispanin family protein [Bacteroidales bacterium]
MNTNQFFYIDNGKQIGPVTMEELAGKITPDTDVWCDGMPDWAKASAVPELSALLGGVQPMSDANFTAQYGSANDYIGNSQNYGSNIQGNSQNYGNNQGYGNPQGMPIGDKPNNYLVWAIIVTVLGVCFCLPMITGIISIVFSVKVDSEWKNGNVEAANQASEKAKLFAIISAILIAVIWVLNQVSGFAVSFLQNLQ